MRPRVPLSAISSGVRRGFTGASACPGNCPGATVADAKAGASPEFLVAKREGAANETMQHAIFRVSDIVTTVAAAKAAGAKVTREVSTVTIGGSPIKMALLTDPQGNALEIMELPKTLTHLPH